MHMNSAKLAAVFFRKSMTLCTCTARQYAPAFTHTRTTCACTHARKHRTPTHTHAHAHTHTHAHTRNIQEMRKQSASQTSYNAVSLARASVLNRTSAPRTYPHPLGPSRTSTSTRAAVGTARRSNTTHKRHTPRTSGAHLHFAIPSTCRPHYTPVCPDSKVVACPPHCALACANRPRRPPPVIVPACHCGILRRRRVLCERAFPTSNTTATLDYGVALCDCAFVR